MNKAINGRPASYATVGTTSRWSSKSPPATRWFKADGGVNNPHQRALPTEKRPAKAAEPITHNSALLHYDHHAHPVPRHSAAFHLTCLFTATWISSRSMSSADLRSSAVGKLCPPAACTSSSDTCLSCNEVQQRHDGKKG